MKKILIVDDEEVIGRVLKLHLERTGRYDVRVEQKGMQGYPAALEFLPDLIILDIVMPDLVGSAVAYQLRADKRTQNIPIIFWSGLVTPGDHKRQIGDIGNSTILPKPIPIADVVSCINSKLEIASP